MTSKTDGSRFPHGEVPLRTWELIRRELMGAPAVIREITEHIAQNMGKGIRTMLLAACAMDEDGTVPPYTVNAASSIELLHLASLVHDDIVDDAPMRRGMASVQGRFGKEKAVLCGDWLVCKAVGQAVNLDDSVSELAGEPARAVRLARLLIHSAEKICLGELAERAALGKLDLTVGQSAHHRSENRGAFLSVRACRCDSRRERGAGDGRAAPFRQIFRAHISNRRRHQRLRHG